MEVSTITRHCNPMVIGDRELPCYCVLILETFIMTMYEILSLIYLLCCGMWCKIKINSICNAGQINFLEAYWVVGS
jgi:hypothetical protein